MIFPLFLNIDFNLLRFMIYFVQKLYNCDHCAGRDLLKKQKFRYVLYISIIYFPFFIYMIIYQLFLEQNKIKMN